MLENYRLHLYTQPFLNVLDERERPEIKTAVQNNKLKFVAGDYNAYNLLRNLLKQADNLDVKMQRALSTYE